jgi:hypothetical protein
MIPTTTKELFAAFGYTLSLPERFARSIAAALGGTSKLVTDTLIPEPLRKTGAYTAIVGNAQRFIIERIADVQGVYEKEAGGALPDDYVPRKIAGNVVDAVGMFSMHLSPLWVFAIATDVAQGSRVYLNRLVGELKEKNVISQDANIDKLDDLLDSLGQAGSRTAQVFDSPPVDLEQIKTLRDQLTGGYSNVFKKTTNLLPRIDTLWKSMESVAKRDGVAVDSIVGLMTIDLGKTAGQAVDAAFAVGHVTSDLLSETILDSYGKSIERIQREGAIACLEQAAAPYVSAIGSHLRSDKESWTEKAMNKMFRWWSPEEVKPDTPPPPTPCP